MLFWFRKGWTLNWSLIVIVAVLYSPNPRLMAGEDNIKNPDAKYVGVVEQLEDKFLRLWLTPNQLGQFYMLNGHYARAAKSYDAIAWRGVAYYRAEDFKAAAEMFSRIESIEGHFNLANAWAHSRNYIKAVKSYNQVLKLDAEHKDDEISIYRSALKNRDRMQKIIDEINLLSASQKAENTDSTRDLPDDQPQTADGAEREDFIEKKLEQLSAEDILLDDSINELWMRQVQKDPSQFLRIKFHMQLEQ
jgi:Ca-activated chloride channel family protein